MPQGPSPTGSGNAGRGTVASSGFGNDAAVKTVDRYPDIEAPDVVHPGQEFAVQVMLTEQMLSPQTQIVSGAKTASGQLELGLPDSPDNLWHIDVILSPQDAQFTQGSNMGKMVVPLDGDSTPAVFYLKPNSGAALGKKTISATLWYQGAYLGRLSRDIQLASPDGAIESTNRSAIAPPAAAKPMTTELRASATPVTSAAPIAMDNGIESADLTVMIVQHVGDDSMMEVTIESPYLQPSTITVPRPKGLDEYLRRQYAELQTRSAKGSEFPESPVEGQGTNDEFLRGLGGQLWDQFAPAAFKDAFWALVDKHVDFHSLQVLTDDPTLPWELMRPFRAGDDDRNFLGLDYLIARWQMSKDPTELQRAPQTDRLNSIVALAPQYPGAMALPGQQRELAALAPLHAQVEPGDMDSLRKLASDWPSGFVHFAGHGLVHSNGTTAEYAIVLEDGTIDLQTWRGMVKPNQAQHPFFFFNACEVGQAQQIGNFVDGWAPELLRDGASGYIGALWPVDDTLAAEFAESFYTALQKAIPDTTSPAATNTFVPIAKVLLAAKLDVFAKTHDPTPLGYVMYGDPNQKIALSEAAPANTPGNK